MGKKILSLFKEAAIEWKKENPLFLGAGISFYVILSLGPILVLMFLIIGSYFGEEEAVDEFVRQIQLVVGERPSGVLREIIEISATVPVRLITILSSIPLIFFGSTMIFFQLKYALNKIFGYESEVEKNFRNMVKEYSFSFLMLMVLAVVFFVIVAKTPFIDFLKDFLTPLIRIPWLLFRILEAVISLGVLIFLFMMIYLILPDKKMKKKEVFQGSVITAVLFMIVQYLVGINAENTRIDNAFGALGSFTILILWIFYSSLVFLFGASFTKVLLRQSENL
jgi:membrane protein